MAPEHTLKCNNLSRSTKKYTVCSRIVYVFVAIEKKNWQGQENFTITYIRQLKVFCSDIQIASTIHYFF
jgi:hypothetical protein